MPKTGLLDYQPDERDLLLSRFWTPDAEIALPEEFGNPDLPWGMLGNDEFGCCFPAAEAHEVMALAASVGHRPPAFTRDSVLTSYAEYLGVEKVTSENDAGTEPTRGSRFFRHTGIEDAEGKKHHIGAFAFEREPDYAKALRAIYDLGVMNLCFSLPQSAEEAFSKAEADGFSEPIVWDYVAGSPIVGGHSIAGIGRDGETGQIIAVSWGRPLLITEGFLEKQSMVSIAHVSHGGLKPDGTNIAGLDWAAMEEALAAVTA